MVRILFLVPNYRFASICNVCLFSFDRPPKDTSLSYMYESKNTKRCRSNPRNRMQPKRSPKIGDVGESRV